MRNKGTLYRKIFLAAAIVSMVCLCREAVSETIIVKPGEFADSDLQNALLAAKPGDIVLIEPGIYYPMDRLSPLADGLPGKPIVIRAKSRGTAVFKAMGNKYGFLLENRKYIEIYGLVLEGYAGCGIKLMASTDCKIVHVTVRESGSHNISVMAGQKIYIENCVSQASNACGIALIADAGGNPGYRHMVKGCKVANNKNQGILVTGNFSEIVNNNCEENGSRAPLDHGIYCIGNGNRIVGNMCFNNPFGSGIRVGSRNHIISRNICRGNGRSGIVVAGSNDTHTLLIEENRLQENSLDGLEINAAEYQPHDLVVRGNMVFGNGRCNIRIRKGVGKLAIQGNLFARSKIQMAIGNDPGRVHLSTNRYFGKTCRFYLRGSNIRSADFFSRMEKTAQCEPETVFNRLITGKR